MNAGKGAGDMLVRPENPVRASASITAYAFAGWTGAAAGPGNITLTGGNAIPQGVYGDITLTANWTAIPQPPENPPAPDPPASDSPTYSDIGSIRTPITKLSIVTGKKLKLKTLTGKIPALKVGKPAYITLKGTGTNITGYTFKVKGKGLEIDRYGMATATKKGKYIVTVTAGGRKWVKTVTVK